MTRQTARKLFHLAHTDLVKLRIFATIVRQRGLSAAAEELGISLPTVSRALADLELRIGMPLCRRGRSGFALTQEGAELATATSELLDGVARFETDVNRISRVHRGSLRIGIIDNVISDSDFRISRALKAINARFPGIYPEVLLLQQSTIEDAVRNRTIDLGITADPMQFQSLTYDEIFAEQSSFYVATGSALDQRLLNGEPLSQLPYIRRRHKAYSFQNVEQRYDLQPGATADGLEAAAIIVSAGLGIALLPENYVEQMPSLSLRKIEQEGTPLRVQFYAVTRATVPATPVVTQMVRILRNPALSESAAA